MKNSLSPFLVTLLILQLLSTMAVSGCSKHSENKSQSIKLASYDGKFYWVDEGTSLENSPIGPDVLEVDYSPKMDTDYLFLHSMTSDRTAMLNLEEFEKFINGGTVREATENEKKNAELYDNKFVRGESLTSVKMKGFTLKVGDLADNVFPSSTMKCNTWESRKGDAILSVYAKELQTYYHGRKRTHS